MLVSCIYLRIDDRYYSVTGIGIKLDLYAQSSYNTRMIDGAVAQLGERNIRIVEVGGSNPLGSTNKLWKVVEKVPLLHKPNRLRHQI